MCLNSINLSATYQTIIRHNIHKINNPHKIGAVTIVAKGALQLIVRKVTPATAVDAQHFPIILEEEWRLHGDDVFMTELYPSWFFLVTDQNVF